MPNCMLDQANFRARWREMTPKERDEMLVETLYTLSLQCPEHRRRTSRLEAAVVIIGLTLASAGILTVAGVPVPSLVARALGGLGA